MGALTKYIESFEAYLHTGILKAVIPLSVAAIVISRLFLVSSRNRRTTRLDGPQSPSYIFGLSRKLFQLPDIGIVYEEFEKKYGPVFAVPGVMGSSSVVLCDPKAVAHFFSKDTFTYQQSSNIRHVFSLFGPNLLWAEGETHKRQRRALSFAFSNSAIRNLTPVFYDSAYTLKDIWDSSFRTSSNDSIVVEVQECMNHISLDSIGIGGFGHDFGSLKGHKSPISNALDSFGATKPGLASMFAFILAPALPLLFKMPTKRKNMFQAISDSVGDIVNDLLERARAEKEANVSESNADKSIIGTLIRSETASSNIHLSLDEIRAQWALIELCRNPQIQENLREELKQFSEQDPSFEELTNGLPYLDAVVRETLRLHPALPEANRVAQEDDIVPLTEPITDADGKSIDSIFIARGTPVRIPVMCLNRSELLWGANSKAFLPSRWLNDDVSKQRAAQLQSQHHILTFYDGPRTCLGRGFALTEFKVNILRSIP
ncbi:Cytochrome P450 86B1 [Termitomyces sp. T112]|nr:Cytochrome P450 86B1 [Termitomyces sp. T112]